MSDTRTIHEVKPDGSRYGLPGWFTVYRNGQPIHHYATERAAIEALPIEPAALEVA